MPEEFDSGYQATEPVSQEPTAQQEPSQTQEPVTTQDSNFFEIKYNKEPVKVSYDEAPTYIQKGMNYDKVHQQVEQYQQRMDRLTNFYGYQSEDQIWQELDIAEQQQQQQQQQELYQDAVSGNPEALNQLISTHPAIQYAQQLQQKQQEQQQLENEWGELASQFPDITPEKIPHEVFQLQEQMASQNKHIPLLDAYLRVNYKSLGQQKEQEAIQKLQGNAQSSPGPLSGGDVSHNTNVSKLSSSDFSSLVDQVLRGERKQL